jgi:hypothetical protein
MFGMEKKPKDSKAFVFDIEKSLANEKERSEIAKRIELRIRKIKDILHTGSSKEVFEKLGIMLNGYHALAIVLGRASQEPKKRKA